MRWMPCRRLKIRLNRKIIFYGSFYLAFLVMMCLLPFQIRKLVSLKKDISDLEAKISQFEIQDAGRGNFERTKTMVTIEITRLGEKILNPQQVFSATSYVSAEAKKYKIEV